jgi:lipopolysaccharide/colanic/teichoic acid biosynthesis glycosyltransferase
MENPSLSIADSFKYKFDIIYFADHYDKDIIESFSGANLRKTYSLNNLYDVAANLTVYELNVILLIEVSNENSKEAIELVTALKKNWLSKSLVIIFLLTTKSPEITKAAWDLRVSDCYAPPFSLTDVKLRISYLFAYKLLHPQLYNVPEEQLVQYQIPLSKRLFDLTIAGTALLCISPILLIIIILIKLDSKGPVFYTSKRVGTGYKVFDFYKFRSMRINADKEVENLKNDNQYGASAFFKLKDDPRVTKLGSFLRKSSIDELPQLFNVVKGDMSIVGNRPLPLYEAEQLTTNEWSMRFLGPAGITGLWQIIKRGKSDMSDRERKKLDNFYNKKTSLWFDLKIVLMTFPALFQKEKV